VNEEIASTDDRPEHALLRVSDELSIPFAELTNRATRSGGPGGQHVNTSATRVEIVFDVGASPSLTEPQRARILEKLATRIDNDGVLRLAASTSRSQHQNREEVTDRLARMLEEALHTPRPRRKTKVSRAAKEERLKSKKRRADTKKNRRPVLPED
jgi:ribosome-associated protein